MAVSDDELVARVERPADEGHGFTKTANRTRAVIEMVRWFARHL